MERLRKIRDEVAEMSQECDTLSINGIKRKRGALERKYKFLKENVPTLFDKICNKEYKPEEFGYMFHCLQGVHDENKSLHDASVKVGSMLVDKYIKPQLNGKK
jgi:hypothetical protein